MTRTSAARFRTDGITRHGLATTDERESLYARARGRCEACGEMVEYTLFEVAHRIANSVANRKRYGRRVIDHPLNKAVTHRNGYRGRACNDAVLCGGNPAACAEIVRRIEAERAKEVWNES